MVAKLNVFTTVGAKLEQVNTLSQLRSLVDQIRYITDIIHSNVPEIKDICHCGSIDNNESLLVIFVENNASFYKVNQYITMIQDALFANSQLYDKIIIKVSPTRYQNDKFRNRTKKLTEQQIHSWNKIANLINRSELVISNKNSSEIKYDSELNDWEVML